MSTIDGKTLKLLGEFGMLGLSSDEFSKTVAGTLKTYITLRALFSDLRDILNDSSVSLCSL